MSATKSSRAAKEPVRKATNLATWLRIGMGNCPMYFSAAFWLARSLQPCAYMFILSTGPHTADCTAPICCAVLM